jgi:arylamine N-acetyltransferase
MTILLDRILDRLGLSAAPPRTLDGLQTLYAAWCAHVPFDNVRKMIALRTGLPLPGSTAEDFFDAWLTTGAGGTCWPTSNALFELVAALGFAARRVAGSMLDLGIVSHGSVKVAIDGQDWLVDSSMLTNVPLRLGSEVVIHEGVFAAEVEPAANTHVIWTKTPANATYLPCRLLVDPSSHEEYVERYEASRIRSPFNERLYARRNRPGELLVLLGCTRLSQTARGVERRDLSREELLASLRDEIGLSDPLIATWVASGGLDATFEPPTGPRLPPVTTLPPSQRMPR